MDTLNALLSGIVAEPLEETRWLVLADWLDENDDPRRAELLRLHRRLIATCCEPATHPERAAWQNRMVELLVAGVTPCVPRHTLMLPGGVPLVGGFIPPGSFLMGGTVNDNEKPVHRVLLTAGFFMGTHPVTQAQWRAVTGAEPSHFTGENRPVECVSWDDCRAFCAQATDGLGGWATVRLPTEEEWEYACRAGTTTEYHFGDAVTAEVANYNGNYAWNRCPKGVYREHTTDAGSFPANAWGLYDVHGNVWEWCADGYGPYEAIDQTDTRGESNVRSLVIRGGAWHNDPTRCRAAFRTRAPPAARNSRLGFRVCFRPN
jgi:uncharacterized protein (TIGR02996 family)